MSELARNAHAAPTATATTTIAMLPRSPSHSSVRRLAPSAARKPNSDVRIETE